MRRFNVDRRLAPAVAGLAVAGVGLAALGLAAAAPSEDRVRGAQGGRVQIALVAPTEPDFAPGPRMEVGELNDGFDRAALTPTPIEMADFAPQDAWLPEAPPVFEYGESGVTRAVVYVPAEPVRAAPAERVEAPAAEPEPTPARQSRYPAFGFEQPRRDFAAERRARREALDARAEQARAAPQGAILRTAEAFY